MATTVTVSHDFPFSCQDYVDIFFDPEFAKYVLSLGKLSVYEPMKFEKSDTRIHRVMMVQPKVDLPGWFKKIIGGDKLAYHEHMTHEVGSKEMISKVVPTVLTGKVNIEGIITLEELPGGGCRRGAKLHVSVSMFGVGGKIEKALSKNVREGYDFGRTNMTNFWNARS